MARLCTLASGSSGNSTYISAKDGDVLIDAGISCKALMSAIEQVGNVQNIRAIAITHTHIDHISGLKTFLKKIQAPVIASSKTLEILGEKDILLPNTQTIVAEDGLIEIGGMAIDFFATSHDAEGSGGYVVTLPDGRRAAVCTDLGIMTDTTRQKLYGCDVALIESNHDVEMLRQGPYNAQLKLRILSDKGHLSNNACANELPTLLQKGTSRIILGHLSGENNTPLLANATARTALASIGAKEGIDYILDIAKPKTVGVTVF